MIDLMRLIAAAGVLAGAGFCLFAALGLVRLPDLYARLHAAAKAGVVGSGLILLSLGVVSVDIAVIFRVILAILFLVLTTPISTHLLARTAYLAGTPLAVITKTNEMKD